MAAPLAEPSQRYLELLSDADLALIGRSSGLTPGSPRTRPATCAGTPS